MITKWLPATMAGILLLSAGSIFAQNHADAVKSIASSRDAYELDREEMIVGTVLTYSEASHIAPYGPRLTLQTASGVVDIHLGDARTLWASHFTIHTGDSLRVIGETVSFANNTSLFLARILQKGNQAIAVRTSHGFLIPPTTPADAKDSRQQRGAM